MVRLVICVFVLMADSGSARAEEPFEGGTLISPLISNDTYMIDLEETVLKTWHGGARPATFAYPLPDESILRPCRDAGGYFSDANAAGGWLQKINASDEVVWDYYFSTDQYQQHHDIGPMPNGNVLVVAWERKTQEEAIAAGRENVQSFEVWSTLIAEIEPSGPTGGNIVWEWHLWDHLIQDVDPEKDNYGVIADHPELVDINSGNIAQNGDWDHANAVSYNPERDEIVFCARAIHELYVVDHSTTSEEAAGHTGGNRGMGGDILYRWGNPQVYDRGDASDRVFYGVHGAEWIAAGLPGEGNILVFNNGDRDGSANDYSSVYEIAAPLDPDGSYHIEAGMPFGPDVPEWTYGDPGDFYAGATHCGAFRMPNGNTLITSTAEQYVFEVNALGTIVWDHIVPSGRISRAPRYSTDTNAVPGDEEAVLAGFLNLFPSRPNPFSPETIIQFDLPFPAHVKLQVFDVEGLLVTTLADGGLPAGSHSVEWLGRDRMDRPVDSGIYLYRLTAPGILKTGKMVLAR